MATALRRRVDKLLTLARERSARRGKGVSPRRRAEAVARFVELLPDDLRGRLIAAGRECRDRWLLDWLESVARGRSRLPECLTGDVVRRLVLARLEEPGRCWTCADAVCLVCGLLYPVSADDRPLFDRDGCPACGASSKAGSMNWDHLMPEGYWFAREP